MILLTIHYSIALILLITATTVLARNRRIFYIPAIAGAIGMGFLFTALIHSVVLVNTLAENPFSPMEIIILQIIPWTLTALIITGTITFTLPNNRKEEPNHG